MDTQKPNKKLAHKRQRHGIKQQLRAFYMQDRPLPKGLRAVSFGGE